MMNLAPKFIDLAPEVLEDGVLYISMEYSSALHKCVCGCGNLVVTPLAPTEWQLFYDGKTVSLYPSIGNWNFDCKSHYWIKKNEVVFARKWTDIEIAAGSKREEKVRKKYFRKVKKRRK
jgi:hypothetical protein